MVSTLADVIDRRRKALGISEHELCRRAKLPRDAVRNIRRGLSENPRIDTVQKLASVFGLTVDALMAEAGLAERAPAFRGKGETHSEADEPDATVTAIEDSELLGAIAEALQELYEQEGVKIAMKDLVAAATAEYNDLLQEEQTSAARWKKIPVIVKKARRWIRVSGKLDGIG